MPLAPQRGSLLTNLARVYPSSRTARPGYPGELVGCSWSWTWARGCAAPPWPNPPPPDDRPIRCSAVAGVAVITAVAGVGVTVAAGVGGIAVVTAAAVWVRGAGVAAALAVA